MQKVHKYKIKRWFGWISWNKKQHKLEEFGNEIVPKFKDNNREIWLAIQMLQNKQGKIKRSIEDEKWNKLATNTGNVLKILEKMYRYTFKDDDLVDREHPEIRHRN